MLRDQDGQEAHRRCRTRHRPELGTIFEGRIPACRVGEHDAMRQQSSDFVSLFEPTIERVLRAEGADFLRELLHLVVEGWLRNGRVAPFVGDMVNESVRWGGGSSTGCAGSTTNCFGLSRRHVARAPGVCLACSNT